MRAHLRRFAASAVVVAAPALSALPATVVAESARVTSPALAYSTASAHVVQRQPPAASCHARGSGLNALPDARCTPGALNPAVTASTLQTTICRRGWTATVRPPASITDREKLASLAAYGEGPAGAYEYDHLVPLELGGAVNDARNLWPEPNYAARMGFYLNPKDRLESTLKRRVCGGTMQLPQAQRLIAADWVSAYRAYG